jgi:hypothetical protein
MIHNGHKIIGYAYNGQILPAVVCQEGDTCTYVIGLAGELENWTLVAPRSFRREYTGTITPEMNQIIESRKM